MSVIPEQGAAERWIPGLVASLASASVKGSSSDTAGGE